MGNWEVVKVQDVNCKDDLFKTERVWVEQLGAKMNTNVPSRSQKEWMDANKEKLIARQKQYYQDHKESALEYQKQYYQDHKESASEYQKQYRQDHKEESKQYYQDHKESALEYQKQYRQDHKEKASEHQKQYRKEKVTCACGSVVTTGNITTHYKSKKHIAYLDSQK